MNKELMMEHIGTDKIEVEYEREKYIARDWNDAFRWVKAFGEKQEETGDDK